MVARKKRPHDVGESSSDLCVDRLAAKRHRWLFHIVAGIEPPKIKAQMSLGHGDYRHRYDKNERIYFEVHQSHDELSPDFEDSHQRAHAARLERHT